MADKLMRAQVTIPRDTLVPADNVVNTLYFDGDDQGFGSTDAEYHSAVVTMLQAFYQAIDLYLSPVIASPATIKIYDMRDAEPRVPEHTNSIALTPGGGSGMPEEVAICCSFRGAVASGVNMARRRGRIYLGPLDSGNGIITGGAYRPGSTLLNAIAAAASTMQNGLDTVSGEHVSWAIYSPTTDLTGTLDDAFEDVVDGWVDNAYDTQRRRGPAASSRTAWS